MLFKNYRQIPDLLLVFGLFFLSNILAFFGAFWLAPELVIVETLFWLMLTILSISILSRHGLIPAFFENLKIHWLMLPFLIFSGLSVFWSIYWEISLYRWLILLCTVITGAYIGLRYSLREIIKLLSVFGIYILLLSSIFVFLVPKIGIMNYYIIQGAWKGIYWHKNHMGLIATFANILFLINILSSLRSPKRGVWLWGLLYAYSLLFVYQTDSVAAYLTTIFLHGVVLLALVLLKFKGKIRKIHYLVFTVVLLLVSLVLYMNVGRFLGNFNRNTSLTGRIPMWTYVFNTYIDRRPLQGYGFNAFWYTSSHRVAVQHAAGYPDPIIIADNGFIDILVNTGYVGLILFLVFYFGAWWRSIRYAINAKDINDFFPLILMSYTLLANISWSLIFENEGFFMLNMISVLACMSGSSPTSRGDG
ncbi:MAG: O-antigen ligase family protein [Anaerolineales bacterium]